MEIASHRFPFKELIVLPIGDVQLGAPGCTKDRLRRHIEWGIKHDARYVGLGDYVDVASPSNRAALRNAELYDSVTDALEDSANRAVKEFLHLVRGTEGKWLGLVEGHHYYDFADGQTSDTKIATALGAPFLGDCAFVYMVFCRGATPRSGTSAVTLWVHHGEGSGQSVAAQVQKLQSYVAHFEADVFLMGHMSKEAIGKLDQVRLATNHKDLTHRTIRLIGTGGWHQGYMLGSKQGAGRAGGLYPEQKMLRPVALGGPVLRFIPQRNKKTDWVEVKAES